MVIVVGGFAPRERTLPEIFQGMLWQNFHEDVFNRGKSLDRTVKVLDFLLDRLGTSNVPEETYYKFFTSGAPIDNLSIAGKIRDYVEMEVCNNEVKSSERDDYESNLTANLSRGLKYMKQNQAFLLNLEDKRHLVNFVSSLSFPPLEQL